MLDRISASLASLTAAEQRVAQLVLDDPHSFSRLPVRVLAASAQVSNPTVVRFCRSLGYEGLADFKLQLAGAANPNFHPFHRDGEANDTAKNLVAELTNEAIQALIELRSAAPALFLEQASDAIIGAYQHNKKIAIFCTTESTGLAVDLQHQLLNMGIASHMNSAPEMQILMAKILEEGDCLVCITQLSDSPALFEANKYAQNNLATTVAVCSNNNPIREKFNISFDINFNLRHNKNTSTVFHAITVIIFELIKNKIHGIN